MWFGFPQGCEVISVERQEFVAEWTDDKGNGYFRAPDHFAPRILAIKGFKLIENLPEGAPADLPKSDPQRDGAIAEMAGVVEAQKLEIQNMRSDMGAMTSRIAALANEKTDLSTKLEAAQAKIAELEDQLEDRPTPEPKKK